MKQAERVGVPTLVFPFVFKSEDGKRKKKLWAKVTKGMWSVEAAERESAERMLFNALISLKSIDKLEQDRVEDSQGRVQVTLGTIATFSESLEEVRQRQIGGV